MIKRTLDLVAAGIGLLLLSPILAAVVILVKCNSPGPIFFRHKRIGKGFRPFCVFKFRSMVADAVLRLMKLSTEERAGMGKRGKEYIV